MSSGTSTGAFEKLRAKNRGKPKLVVSRRPDHRQQSRWAFITPGAAPTRTPIKRYFAMTGHELRYQNGFDCQGLWVEVEVEKELKLQSKRDIENLVPGDRSPASTASCSCARTASTSSPASRPNSRSASATGWTGTAPTRTGPSRRTSASLLHDVGGEQLHDLELPEEVPRARSDLSRLRRHAVVPALRRRPQPDGNARRLPARRPSLGVREIPPPRSRKRERPETQNLLVWTTTPWTLTSNVGRRRQSGADVPESASTRTRSITSPRAPSRRSGSKSSSSSKEWVEGVPKLKTLEQIFKEKGGFEIVGEVKGAGHGRLGLRRPVRRIAGPGAPGGLSRARSPTWSPSSSWAPAESARDAASRRRLGRRRRDRRHGHRPHRPGLRQGRLRARQREAACRRSRRSTISASSCPASANLTGKSAVDPATTDWILANLQAEGRLLAVEKYPHSYPHCWRCKTELLFRLVDEWFINMTWRDEIMARRRAGDVRCRSRSTARPASWTGSRTWATG